MNEYMVKKDQVNSSPKYTPQELKTGIQRNISMPVFTTALFTIARGENKQNKQNV